MALCRSLELRNSDTQLLRLAPSTLKALTYELYATNLDPAIFRTRSSLKKLELIDTALLATADCRPLQRLPLEELVLIDCPRAASAILAPGALKALRRLHIDDDEWKDTVKRQARFNNAQLNVRSYSSDIYDSDSNDSSSDDTSSSDTSSSSSSGSSSSGSTSSGGSIVAESNKDRVSSFLQNLPNLERISGRSHLLAQGMTDFLEDWYLVWHENHEAAKLSRQRKSAIPVWTKT